MRAYVAPLINIYSVSIISEDVQTSLKMASHSSLTKTNTITEARDGVVRVGCNWAATNMINDHESLGHSLGHFEATCPASHLDPVPLQQLSILGRRHGKSHNPGLLVKSSDSRTHLIMLETPVM